MKSTPTNPRLEEQVKSLLEIQDAITNQLKQLLVAELKPAIHERDYQRVHDLQTLFKGNFNAVLSEVYFDLRYNHGLSEYLWKRTKLELGLLE